eukprot:553726_1
MLSGDYSLVWFWVFACLIVPCFLLVSAFSLLQFRNVLVIIMNISTKSVPGWLSPMLLTVKTAISEAFGNPRKYKPKMTEVLIYSLIIAVLMLLPALWSLYEKQASVVTVTSQSRTKRKGN